jgi:hypothetical protein
LFQPILSLGSVCLKNNLLIKLYKAKICLFLRKTMLKVSRRSKKAEFRLLRAKKSLIYGIFLSITMKESDKSEINVSSNKRKTNKL